MLTDLVLRLTLFRPRKGFWLSILQRCEQLVVNSSL